MAAADILDIRADDLSKGWAIINGRGEQLAITMLSPSIILAEAPGIRFSDKLRYVIETGQVLPGWRIA